MSIYVYSLECKSGYGFYYYSVTTKNSKYIKNLVVNTGNPLELAIIHKNQVALEYLYYQFKYGKLSIPKENLLSKAILWENLTAVKFFLPHYPVNFTLFPTSIEIVRYIYLHTGVVMENALIHLQHEIYQKKYIQVKLEL